VYGPGAPSAAPPAGAPVSPPAARVPPPQPDEPGLTYGEAIERQRKERRERERPESEQALERSGSSASRPPGSLVGTTRPDHGT
jgi:hypothetical protein